jgi:hypothetical protein
MTMTRAVVIAAAVLASAVGAGCGGDSKPYAVDVIVSGSANAFSTFSVQIGPKQVQTSATGGQVELCTRSQQKFLEAPVPLVVRQGGTTVSSDSLERFACKLSDTPGHIELDYLFLQDDGSLLHDLTAGDPRVWATCVSLESACSGEDL